VRQGSLCYLLRVFLSILFVCSCQALRHLLCKFLGLISSMRSVFACTGGAQCRPVQAMAPPCPVPELQVWRGPYFSWPDPTSRIKKKTKSASPTTPSRPPAAVQRPYLTVPYLPPATPSCPVDRLRSLPCRLGAVAAPSRALPLTSSSLRQLLPSYYALSCRSVELAMRDVAKQLRYASTVDPIIPGKLLDIVRQIRNGIVPLAIFW
jgi:hypothetical protein